MRLTFNFAIILCMFNGYYSAIHTAWYGWGKCNKKPSYPLILLGGIICCYKAKGQIVTFKTKVIKLIRQMKQIMIR